MDILTLFLPNIEHFGDIGYWLIFLVAFIESTAFFGTLIPGSIIVVFAGFLSGQGYLNIVDLIWFTALGAILGDIFSYYLGKKGTRFFKNENKILKIGHLDKGKIFFKKYGDKSVFFGRFLAKVRPIIAFIAGLSEANIKGFLLWNILGGFIWAVSHLILGYFFGEVLRLVGIWSTRIVYFSVVLILVIGSLWFILKRVRTEVSPLLSLLFSIKDVLVNNNDVKKFVLRHHTLFRFVRGRLEFKNFFGLPLTTLCIAFVYTIFLLGGIVIDVLRSDLITQADIRIVNLLYLFRDDTISNTFFWITMLGELWIVLAFASIISIMFWLYKRRFYILSLWLTIIGSGGTTYLAKLIVHRARPGGNISLLAENTYSFPSGHATVAVAFYGFIIYFILRNVLKRKYKIDLTSLLILTILAIGFSRLYLGVHYLSDVFGGYLIGAIWLIIGISINEWLLFTHKTKETQLNIKNKRIVSYVLVFAGIIIYITSTSFSQFPSPITATPLTQQIIGGDILNIFSEYKLPKYSEGLAGEQGGPISFIIIAKDDQTLLNSFEKSGWITADQITLRALYKIARGGLLNTPYPSAPMTPSFWNAKVNEFNFQKPTDTNTVRERHHSRFWKTNILTSDSKHIYVGTASLDIGIKWGVTHKISPDLNTERETIFSDLLLAGVVDKYSKEQLTPPHMGKNYSGDQFFSDGKTYILYLN